MNEHERTAPPHRRFAPTGEAGQRTAMDLQREQEARNYDIQVRVQCIKFASDASAGKPWTADDVAVLAERLYLFASNK